MKFGKKSKLLIIPAMLASFGTLSLAPLTAEAWTDQTHMAIERAAGLSSYQNACAPDVSKTVSAITSSRKTTVRGISLMPANRQRAKMSKSSSR